MRKGHVDFNEGSKSSKLKGKHLFDFFCLCPNYSNATGQFLGRAATFCNKFRQKNNLFHQDIEFKSYFKSLRTNTSSSSDIQVWMSCNIYSWWYTCVLLITEIISGLIPPSFDTNWQNVRHIQLQNWHQIRMTLQMQTPLMHTCQCVCYEIYNA